MFAIRIGDNIFFLGPADMVSVRSNGSRFEVCLLRPASVQTIRTFTHKCHADSALSQITSSLRLGVVLNTDAVRYAEEL